jgi:hypothetical protein
MRNYCNFLTLLLLYLILPSYSQSLCGVDQLTRRISLRSKDLSSGSSYSRESTFSPIRISVEFLSYESNPINTYIKDTIIKDVVQWYSNVLQVKRLTSPLKIDESFREIEELDLDIPEKYYTEGIDADYLFFILIISRTSASYAGAAIDLQRDPNTHQPVIGVFIINYIESRGHYSYDDLFLIAVHEMAHALVFYNELYPYFRDASGNLYDPEDMFKYDTIRGTSVVLLTTPNVLKYAQESFNCYLIQGVELEQTGGLGTVNQHWDKRVMNGDFMGPDINVEDYVMSDITLGLFEDSGWYMPRYEYTQTIKWGYQQGCGFIDRKCIIMQKPTNKVFCSEQKDRCDYNRLNKGTCNLKMNQDLPGQFSYFKDGRGGSDPYVDYCPYIEPVPGGNCRGHDYTETDLNSDYGEQACENCRCVEGTYSKNNQARYHLGCHWIECEEDYTIVHIGDETVECDSEGGEVKVPNYNGVLYCPKWEEVCNPVPCMNACSGIGICKYGICECPDGSMGGDCTNIEKDFSYRDPIPPRYNNFSSILHIPLSILIVIFS